jgi:L-alanine-DL-glutamate epimerase-like enolase superfamily enzyme
MTRRNIGPFFAALGLFVMSYIGIAISLWPMIVPGHFTIREAAASPSTLKLHEIKPSAVRAAREEAGAISVELMLDVNCPWTLYEARTRAMEFEEFNLKWLEEPLWPPENFDGLAQLRRACRIPIAAGENVSTLMEFERLLAAEAVDFVQPSPAKMGGITELCKVFPIAAVRNITVMPHCFYDGPGLLADSCDRCDGNSRFNDRMATFRS